MNTGIKLIRKFLIYTWIVGDGILVLCEMIFDILLRVLSHGKNKNKSKRSP